MNPGLKATDKDKLLRWFVNGHVGVSSRAIASAACGIAYREGKRWGSTPADPSDFKRCLDLIEAVPALRSHLDKVAKTEPAWARIVEKWDELERIYREEQPSGKAPRTWALLKALNEPQDDA